MAKAAIITASGAVKAGAGTIEAVNIVKAGDATATVIVYDNPSAASGTILFQATGVISGSFIQGLSGVVAATGIYCAVTGSTVPQVQVIYQ